jgi:lipoate-protein ligase B
LAQRQIALLNLGIEPYAGVQTLQHQLVDLRQRELIGDVLILLEHAPVITLGRRANRGNILASDETLAREGIVVAESERGGDVTYHGPGQLVGYPILYLPDHHLGASDYMHRLEDVIAASLADFGIATHRRDGIIGVWAGEDKIAALGVRIQRRVTYHGFALNVAPNMRHWSYIIPCGITDGGVTSMARELERAPDMGAVRRSIAQHFAALFHAELIPTTEGVLTAVAAAGPNP